MILILGSSGAVGIPTIRALVERAAPVRALTSSDESADRLKALGVKETVRGDLRSEADLARALQDADSVFFVMPRFQEDEADAGKRIVAAARKEGVGHFVYCSVFHPQLPALDHHWRKLQVEEAVIESGLRFTILQPSSFMQNIRREWSSVSEKGVYPRPYSPDRKMSVVDTTDLGEAAARVLTMPELQGGTYELCGPGPITHSEMAKIISGLLGKPVRAEKSDITDWQEAARARGGSDYFIAAYSKMCAHYDRLGFPGGNTLALRAILGREPTGYYDFMRRFIAEQQAAG